MCRNIKTLYNYEPPATIEEIEAASLQFVRKISGFNKPSRVNQQAFDSAIDNITQIAQELLTSLETQQNPRNREEEKEKARLRNQQRFGS